MSFDETYVRWFYRILKLEHSLCYMAPRVLNEINHGCSKRVAACIPPFHFPACIVVISLCAHRRGLGTAYLVVQARIQAYITQWPRDLDARFNMHLAGAARWLRACQPTSRFIGGYKVRQPSKKVAMMQLFYS